jgi:iron-sulfur cluster repair protein YtfE (RIC family)
MTDPIQDLAHDHSDINRRVLALGSAVRALGRDHSDGMALALVTRLDELRELLFLHFAREEEGLFPFVSDTVADLAEQIHAMALAHDAICGGLALMCHLAATNAEIALITTLFSRFEIAYASHHEMEAQLLHTLGSRLDRAQRDQLAALVRGL